MATRRSPTVYGRAPRVLATLGVLVAAVLALSTVTTAPSADAATVLGQFRNATGRCLENLDDATTANNKIQINACGPRPTRGSSSAAGHRQAIKSPPGDAWAPSTTRPRPAPRWCCRAATRPSRPSAGGAHRRLVVNRQAMRCLAPLDNSATNGTRIVITASTTATAMRWSVPRPRRRPPRRRPPPRVRRPPPRPPPRPSRRRRRPPPHHHHNAAPGRRDPIRQPSRRTRSGTCRSAAARCTGRRTCPRCREAAPAPACRRSTTSRWC